MKRTHSFPKKYAEYVVTFPKKKSRDLPEDDTGSVDVNNGDEINEDNISKTKDKKCKKDDLDDGVAESIKNNSTTSSCDREINQDIITENENIEHREDAIDDETEDLNINKNSTRQQRMENADKHFNDIKLLSDGKKKGDVESSLDTTYDDLDCSPNEKDFGYEFHYNSFSENSNDDSIEVRSICSSDSDVCSFSHSYLKGRHFNDSTDSEKEDSFEEFKDNIKINERKNDDNNNKNTIDEEKENLTFTIPFSEWVKLPFVDKDSYRRLGGNWSDVFSRHFNKVQPTCVLVFKYNRISRSNKAAQYGSFSANCKHKMCSAVYKMTISDEPDGKSAVEVNVSRTGKISERNEEESRFVKDQRRSLVKQELTTKSPYMYRSELLLEADSKQLNAGNFSTVPTKDVLKQIRAEERQYEKLSDYVIREIYAVKKTFEILDTTVKPVNGYIQFIGFEPFFVINFCGEQISLLRDACRREDCYLYFDSTGLSMKRPMDQPKRIYMYCLVLQTRRHEGGVRVAEMLTNDHSTPSITNFLLRVRQAITTGSFFRAPRKIETDFSFAMIHAACRALNSCSLVNYLTECWNSITSSTTLSSKFTILHICAAHMLKLFQKLIAQSTEIKDVRKFWLYVLARLQTSTSLEMATSLVEDITTISRSKLISKTAKKALDRLSTTIKMQGTSIEEENAFNLTYDAPRELLDGETLRSQSPFYEYFEKIIDEAYISDALGYKNPFYIPTLPEKILKQYLPFFPLWSGILLLGPDRNLIEGSNRDTNAVVESHFSTIKNEILQKEKNINPAKACRLFYVSAKGLAKSSLVSAGKRRVKDDTQEEEKWERSGQRNITKKKKSKYFSSPSNLKFMKVNEEVNDSLEEAALNFKKSKTSKKKSSKDRKERDADKKRGQEFMSTEESSFDFTDENAMKWGGFDKVKTGISLSNTCTIDNILTALHIIISSRSDVRLELSKCKDTAIQLVLEICLNDMRQRRWTDAKIKFVKDLLRKQGSNVDLFGSEFEMTVKHLVNPQSHITETECIRCLKKKSFRKDLIELGLGRHNQNTIHDLLFDWEHGTSSRCPLRCGGKTTTTRHFESTPVLLFVTVDLASAEGRLITDSLIDPVIIVGQQYDLYAATLNRHGHFRLLVRSKSDGPWYSYDGLRAKNRFEKLERFRCRSNETVVNLIYVKCQSN